MKREDARRIIQSQEITYGQIQDMLRSAYNDNYPDRRPSKTNANYSTAFVFNGFWKAFKDKDPTQIITWDDEFNALESIIGFGEFGPREWQPSPQPAEPPTPAYHQEPINPYDYD